MSGPPRSRLVYAEAGDLIQGAGLQIAAVVLPERAAFHHSTAAGTTAAEFDPQRKVAPETAALWTWVANEVGLLNAPGPLARGVSRIAAIKSERASLAPPEAPRSFPLAAPSSAARAAARSGNKAVSGYFSGELSRALHRLALDREVSLQALMSEAFDDLLGKYGHHPFGER
jgi:hypothetical protein